MKCPKCGSEMLPCIDKNHPLMKDSTYHFTGSYHCMKCGHEEKVKECSHVFVDGPFGEYCELCGQNRNGDHDSITP